MERVVIEGVNLANYGLMIYNAARNMRVTGPLAYEIYESTGSFADEGKPVAPDADPVIIGAIVFSEETNLRTYLKKIYDPYAKTGTRPWMKERFNRLSTVTEGYANLDVESVPALIKMLEAVGRDMKKIPVTEDEFFWYEAQCIVGFGNYLSEFGYNRHLGTGPTFGGVGGSLIVAPPDIA